MKFKSLNLKNYRQYKNNLFDFEENLHIIKAIMGTGKSNLLNAINWCLYGDEPFLRKKNNQSESIINKKLQEELEDQQTEKVEVELNVEFNGKLYTFVREKKYIFKANNEGNLTPEYTGDQSLEIIMRDELNNSKFIQDEEEVNSIIQRFIPEKIRNYFFFDGENLEKYFEKNSTDEIKSAIQDISMVSLLSKIIRRLRNLITDYNNETSKLDVELKDLNKNIEDLNTKINTYKSKKENKRKKIDIGKTRINEINKILGNNKTTKEIQNKIDHYTQDKLNLDEEKTKYAKQKVQYITKNGPFVFLNKPLENLKKYIEKKKDTKEYPMTNDKVLLENILKKKKCVCGTEVTNNSRECQEIKSTLDRIKFTNEDLNNLISIEGVINDVLEKLPEVKTKINEDDNYIKAKKTKIAKIEEKISDLNKKIENTNIEEINDFLDERKEIENEIEQCTKDLSRLETNLNEAIKERNEKEETRDKRRKNKSKLSEINKKIEFLEKAKSKAEIAKKTIMDEIQTQIINETNNIFFELMWKKETYKEVQITDDYQIDVIDYNNKSCINDLSGGENEILALSFTLALQSISGFDAPLVIDRPLAMVSGPSRKDVAKAFVEISNDKQIFLLFTPHDLSDIEEIFQCENHKVWDLKLAKNEKEILY